MAKTKAKKPKGPPADPWWKRAFRVVFRLTLAATVALVLGSSLVVWVLYRQALGQVRARLEADMWELPGEVRSGPIEVWPGMQVTPEDLASDLEAAGFVKVSGAPTRDKEMSVSSTSIVARVPADSGPSWKTTPGDLKVSFKSGKVSGVSPGDSVLFPPLPLARIRGDDNETRTPRKLEDFPKNLRNAVLAMEDARFFEHKGVSPIGILRALLTNLQEGERVQGGSTLTQQLAKNLFLSQERTLTRKGHEVLLAFALERELSKEEILALYLNEIYWGQAGGAAICGAEEAAKAYFAKPVDRLELGEAATLGGMISSPNTYNPLRHPEKAKERRDIALKRMVEVGWLDAKTAEAEMKKPLVVKSAVQGRRAPWVVDGAVDAAEDALGEGIVAEEGLTIQTLINPVLQRIAEEAVAESVEKLDATYPEAKGAQMAMVVVRPSDGAILAMVGGRDYAKSQFNRAAKAERQAGSTVKPLTMLTLFDGDPTVGPATFFMDEPVERTIDGKRWTPSNYDGQYIGEVSVRDAIAQSRNIPALLMAEKVGLPQLQATLVALGISGAHKNPSLALGAFEATPTQMAGAYTVFPGKGMWSEPRLVRAISDSDGRTLADDKPVTLRRASARASWLAVDVLRTVMESGTGSRAASFGASGSVGGKSGTTDNYRDAWFVGFSPTLVTAVWVGFDEGKNVGLPGSKAALPAWARFMGRSGTLRASFPAMPKDIVQSDFCSGGFDEVTGMCLECIQEYFTAGQEPSDGCEPARPGLLDQVFGDAGTTTQPKKQKPKKHKRWGLLWW